jgi:hypothetical protein
MRVDGFFVSKFETRQNQSVGSACNLVAFVV